MASSVAVPTGAAGGNAEMADRRNKNIAPRESKSETPSTNATKPDNLQPSSQTPQKPPTPVVEESYFPPITTEAVNQDSTSTTPTPSVPMPAHLPAATLSSEPPKPTTKRPVFGSRKSGENQSSPATKGPLHDLKNQSTRRGSWFSSLGSKMSSSSPGPPPRNTSLDSAMSSITPPPASSKVEFANPFNKKENSPDPKGGKKEEKQVIVTHTQPVRRQSVLVHAGQERKEANPGFLQNALRRLSSSNTSTMGKGAASGAICPRKVMNIDENRDRVQIADFDQNELKRVAFCVDVEIAGYAQAQDEEEDAPPGNPGVPIAPRQSTPGPGIGSKGAKDAKYKEKGEGAALKNPRALSEEKEETGTTQVDVKAAADHAAATNATDPISIEDAAAAAAAAAAPPPTKKKEKKKRTEAERKERKERKRRLAEQNGEVPLELTLHDSDSEASTQNMTPAGALTPSRASESPTTDPLRIYKRCCQLRETSVLKRVLDQISKPSSTLAEAPGTVGVLDLSGSHIPLEDIITLGDWLAVVPVRKLALDDCGLSDEGVRVILSGLSGCKSAEQAKMNKKLPRRGSGKRGQEQLGVIEKLTLKHNQFTALGWKHIALFLHMSRSIKGIDLSGNPFPGAPPDSAPGKLAKTNTASSGTCSITTSISKTSDIGSLFTKALRQMFGSKLEELILSSCSLRTEFVASIVDIARQLKIKRLGLADNHLSRESLENIGKFLTAGICEGLDLGSNNLHSHLQTLTDGLDSANPLWALSLSDCSLTPSDLDSFIPSFAKLKHFRFLDLSQNHSLFSTEPTAVAILRKTLPRLTSLRRIHLADCNMTSEDAIALAEILPDCPTLAHVSILENEKILQIINSNEEASQEQACALFVSLMTAARVSKTVIAIEIEVPSADSSEVVKALASQVVAYTLRNMEQTALGEFGVNAPNTLPDKDAPDVLLHLVGHMEGYSVNHDDDDPAPDEDYLIASTGIVKALRVCLGNKDDSRSASRSISPSASGTATPRRGTEPPLKPVGQKKPKDVALQLCDSARKIRMRLKPALVREDQAGNDRNYQRLQLLDSTLERIIQRFEDEYPETKVALLPSPPTKAESGPPPGPAIAGSLADNSILSTSTESNGISGTISPDADTDADAEAEEGDLTSLKLTHNESNTSLAARAQTQEEGAMHRLGQKLRREIIRPTGTLDYAHGTSVEDKPEPPHVAAFRNKMEQFSGHELREKVKEDGVDSVIKQLGFNMEELRLLEKDDPEAFAALKAAQETGLLNSRRASEAAEVENGVASA